MSPSSLTHPPKLCNDKEAKLWFNIDKLHLVFRFEREREGVKSHVDVVEPREKFVNENDECVIIWVTSWLASVISVISERISAVYVGDKKLSFIASWDWKN
jgi:hypothetical protein